MSAQFILYLAAALILFLGAILDHPRFGVMRCIALGLALVTLAQIIK
jgi:hypothetical protein